MNAAALDSLKPLLNPLDCELERMPMYKYVFAVAVMALTSTACLAAQEFYVAQDAKTKKCNVAREKPDGMQKIMVGTSSYSTIEEARAATHAAPECNPTEKK